MSGDVRQIEPLQRPPQATVHVPGSKSITNRALLLAALADGVATLRGALFSDDTKYMAAALRDMGTDIEEQPEEESFTVYGTGGRLKAPSQPLFIGNAGTAARFLTAACCLGHGRFEIDGTPRMRQRPIADLVGALRQLGARIECPTGCPPVYIDANGLPGGSATVSGEISSQYLSALLMVAPYADHDVELAVNGKLTAAPYVAMTTAMMGQFGVDVVDRANRGGPGWFSVEGCRRYFLGQSEYRVEPDASSAHYFFAAAALTGGEVRIEGLEAVSFQGDAGFTKVLERMGAEVRVEPGATLIRGPARLAGIDDIDMNPLSDTAPTLAVLAAFATSKTRIRGVGHIRRQESDRIHAVTTELLKLGAAVEEHDDGWTIHPSTLHGGEVETYDDHRIAMAFALVGLKVPGIVIRDPGCVSKTFPDFFDRLEDLRR